MSGDVHVRFRERLGGRFPGATRRNVYVRSRKAGQRVMSLLTRLYDKLHLQINESKSAVTSALGRKFLGYELWMAPKGEVKRAVSRKAQATFKQQIRWRTRRSGGRSISEVIDKLRRYVLGWKAYFDLAQTPRVWRELDEWMRHRMRAIHLKQWRRSTTIYRRLRELGASDKVALLVAQNSRRWWRNSRMALNNVLTMAYFDGLGMPRLPLITVDDRAELTHFRQ
jgi:RNA-directed DNA polymerase